MSVDEAVEQFPLLDAGYGSHSTRVHLSAGGALEQARESLGLAGEILRTISFRKGLVFGQRL
jgi:hypothetical protein